MSRVLANRLRLWLLPLLVLGVMLRPVLIIACDVHAVLHAHADAPHDHTGDAPGAANPGDAHGGHDTPQDLKGAEFPAHPPTLAGLAPATQVAPAPVDRFPPRARAEAPPLRPPIA